MSVICWLQPSHETECYVTLQEMFDDALLSELRLYVKLNIVKKLVIDNCRWINKVKLDFQDHVFF